jgi:hypothetical protein
MKNKGRASFFVHTKIDEHNINFLTKIRFIKERLRLNYKPQMKVNPLTNHDRNNNLKH